MRLLYSVAALAVLLATSIAGPLTLDNCAGKKLLKNTYIGPNQDVLAEHYSCENTFTNNAIYSMRQPAKNVCGAACVTSCYTPSGGGPDPNDCQVITDALLFKGQNVSPFFTVGTASDTTTNFIRLRYSSCNSTIVNQDTSNIEYCYSDWAGVTGYVANNCQATQNAHGGICVAANQEFFVQINHS
ncbi:hypothetical protein FIBSPDRAFT_849120 [Athelia psychrophila]|uniref:Uncharacterized protein n=1 Tax=Athelia psychrophila TaxID=1759441 RepID=A0A166UXL1_9AGAM|nr:hypothetical protein FIBSPDRAFT_849120 [Fibularhizoctonia sp. CBS 109695]